ncbi:MAG TPA: phosphoglucosamine mutase [Nitrososphaeraceae archaeon]|nr:phosphoglucosamine mutase [Nitrososphaeraceae archaeon]
MTKLSENNRLFGTNGIRGIFGKDLTVNSIVDACYSLATYFEKGPIVIGHDGRNSSPVISKLVRSTINSAGLEVGDAGLLPTPCLQYAAKRLGYNGGIMITASHNPPEYNGLKAIASDGVEISREDELRVQDIYISRKFSRVNGFARDFMEQFVIDSYIEAALALVNVQNIRSRKFTVVIDTGNGAQAKVAPLILGQLGCKVITINGNIDGNFPGRGPEPTTENLHLLSSMVNHSMADVGVAYDGDGDRSMFCNEKGCLYGGDKTGTLLVKYLLENKHPKADIVCPLNTTMALSLVAKEKGANLVYTKVGSVEVSREMVKRKSMIGLEENGGFMYGMLNEVRDGIMTTALILDALALSGQELSGLLSSLPSTFQYKSKFSCPTKQIAMKVIDTCLKHGNPKRVETLDGAKIWIDEETWIMVRASGTEPLIRMYAESTDKMLLKSKLKEYIRLIKSKISGNE